MIDILLIEDNEEIGGLVVDFLIAEGYDCYLALDGEEGLAVYEDEGAKLILLDVTLPGIDGFVVCKRIRDKQNTPIIIISAKGSKEDKLNGLLLGADDYIEKPFDIDILLAKIDGIFKRRYDSDEIVEGNIRLDKKGRRLYLDDVFIETTVKEFDLLLYMMEKLCILPMQEMMELSL